MSAFKAFKQFQGPIKFPGISGKIYSPPPVSYEMGLQLKLYQERVAEIQQIVADNLEATKKAKEEGKPKPKLKELPSYVFEEDEGPTPENMLSEPVLAEMKKNKEPYDMIEVATHTVWMDFLYGRDVAEAYWNSGGDPKVVAQMLYGSGRDHKIPLTSTSTEAEPTTKKPASTSGTTSRKKSNKKSTSTTKTTPKKPKKSA